MFNRNLSYEKQMTFALIIAAFFLFFGVFTLASGVAMADNDKVQVETPLGPVIGFSTDGVSAFLGLPYAAPPVGQYRFAPPRDVEPWASPREALKTAPMAVQVPLKFVEYSVSPDHASPGISEDCLYLNIWKPESAKKGDKLPVYYFIHGGGFAIGSESQYDYDGSNLARQGIIVVTVGYRLGALGFLSTQETLKRYGTTGNWGILDQIKGLEWVRDNIEAFGGDPQKVTIGGESAGSFSVSALILSPMAKGLFRGAIMESGVIISLGAFPFSRGELDLALNLGKIVLSIFGAKDDAQGLAKLQEADASFLARLTPFGIDFRRPTFLGLSPVKDDRVIPKNPQESLVNGEAHQVKVLMGFNRDEGSIFVPADSSEPELYKEAVFYSLGPEGAKAFWDRFPVDEDNDLTARVRQSVAYSFFTAGAKRFADIHSAQADLYFYRFDYESPAVQELGLGASHASELPFVFGVKAFGEEQTIEEKQLTKEVQLRWVNFIKTGDPNTGTTLPTQIKWPKYDRAAPEVLIFDKAISVSPLPDKDNLDFMAELLLGPLPAVKK
jgi:para-nitrobenzyl esterase